MLRTIFCLGLGSLWIVPLAGCGGGRTSVVKGHVTYKGTNLSVGTVSFFDEKGQLTGSGGIAEGRYRVEKIAPGSVRIAVRTPPAPAARSVAPPASAIGSPQKVVPVPERFAHPDRSGLTYVVTPELEQIHDLDLK